MRLIKLSTQEFATENDLQNYFNLELPSRTPSGLFIMPSGRISSDGLKANETLLFSYQNYLRYVAKAVSVRLSNIYEQQHKYPYCFLIDMESLQEINIPIPKVEDLLRRTIGLKKSLQTQGWPIIPDSEKAEETIKKLFS